MAHRLDQRLARMEAGRSGPPPYFVELSADAWDNGEEHLERATAAAIRAHQERTGYRGPVLVGPKPCETEEEWLAENGAGGSRGQ